MMCTRRIILAVATALVATAAWPQQPFDLDPSFRFNAQTKWITSIYPLLSGDIIVSGWLDLPGEWPIERGGVKLHADGSLDPDFPMGALMGGKITPWQDRFYCGNGQGLRRLHLTGELDTSYIPMSHNYSLTIGQGGDYHVFPDGRVLISGLHLLNDPDHGYTGTYGLIWFTNQGYLDSTRIHRPSNGAILYMAQLPDGKFICSSLADHFDGHQLSCSSFRVMPDGALDTTFQIPPGYVNIKASLPLADGKLLIGGDASYLDSGDTLNLMRLLPDGSIDPTFHSVQIDDYNPIYGGYLGGIVASITPLGTDRYIISGSFSVVDGEPRGGIALIDTSGHLVDEVFTGEGCVGFQWWDDPNPMAWVHSITGVVPAPDGSYYIYGAYHGYDDGVTNDPQQRFVSRLYGLNVGIKEHSGPQVQQLHLAPNPSNGGAVVLSLASRASATDMPATVALEATVHDASGRVVLRERWPAGRYTHTLQAGRLSPGAYVVRVVPAAPLASRASAAGAASAAGGAYTARLVVVP